MTTHQPSADAALHAADVIRERLAPTGNETAVILGTGWNDAIEVNGSEQLRFTDIPGFSSLARLEGHPRLLIKGKISGKPVLALRGRVHLNEDPTEPEVLRMVRLQTEMLCVLGIRRLIITCGAGSLSRSVRTGDLVVIDGFVTSFAPSMPLYAGEFCSPEDALDPELIEMAFGEDRRTLKRGGYLMLRGPQFEGRRYDKAFLASTGAKTVGMSVLPEACVASLYRGVRALALAFVTNDMTEEHSHAVNVQRAVANGSRLAYYLGRMLNRMSP